MAYNTRFFLGANTPRGFVSLFDELYNPYITQNAYIIKGGPGTGKSTFMKKVAASLEEKGFSTERIYCASDPQSLDGVICREKGLSIADGTAPHCLEPRFPGAAENIINTGQFWDEALLKKNHDEILSLTVENSLHHRRSSACLAAAGNLIAQSRASAERYMKKEKADSFCRRFLARELPAKKGSACGKKSRRFISAVTGEGTVFFSDSLTSLSLRIFALEDRYSLPSEYIVSFIGEGAAARGYDVIFCPCPMKPDVYEHLIIPEAGISLFTAKKEHPAELLFDRVIHCDRFMSSEISQIRQFLSFNRRLTNELIKEAQIRLGEAKKTHDKLEKLYAPAMDFDSFSLYTEKFTDKICGDTEI